MQSNDNDHDAIPEGAEATNLNTSTVEVLDNVFDEMDNIEETAAKVLYGLQNMDRTESPQSFSVAIGQASKEINLEFLDYANFTIGKKDAVSLTYDD